MVSTNQVMKRRPLTVQSLAVAVSVPNSIRTNKVHLQTERRKR